jgi:hypothetical protein
MKFGEQVLDEAYKSEHFQIGHPSTIIMEPMEIAGRHSVGSDFSNSLSLVTPLEQ